MSYNEIFDKVTELLASQLPVDQAAMKPESRMIEDLGADSANIMILICDVENEFGITVDNDMLTKIVTVDDLVKYLESEVK